MFLLLVYVLLSLLAGTAYTGQGVSAQPVSGLGPARTGVKHYQKIEAAVLAECTRTSCKHNYSYRGLPALYL